MWWWSGVCRKLWIPRLQSYNALLQASPSSDWQVSACHVFIVTPVWQSTCDKVWRMTAPHYPARRFLSDPSSVSVTRHVSWRCDNIDMFQICLPTKGVKQCFAIFFKIFWEAILFVESTLFGHSLVSKDPENHPSSQEVFFGNWNIKCCKNYRDTFNIDILHICLHNMINSLYSWYWLWWQQLWMFGV